MNSSILTTYNSNRGTVEDRAKHRQEMKTLSEKNAKKVIIVFPNGEEKEFDSCMQADRFLKLTAGNVRRWVKEGSPSRGRFKFYSARYA